MSDLYSVTINNEDIIMQVSDIDFGTVVIGGTQMAQVSVMGGVPGPPGATGPGSAGFNFTQSTPASTWIINHNLGYRPVVELMSSGGMEMIGEVLHISVNQVQVSFNEAVDGFARLV